MAIRAGTDVPGALIERLAAFAARVRYLPVCCALVPELLSPCTYIVAAKSASALDEHALACGVANMVEFAGKRLSQLNDGKS